MRSTQYFVEVWVGSLPGYQWQQIGGGHNSKLVAMDIADEYMVSRVVERVTTTKVVYDKDGACATVKG